MHALRHTVVNQHHLLIMIIMIVGVLFTGNIIALNQIQQQVTSLPSRTSAPVILARFDNDDQVAQASTKPALEPLAEELSRYIGALDTPVSIAIYDLKTEEYLGINDKTTMKAASFYKLFVGYEVLRLIDSGELKWSDTVSQRSLRECFNLMITVSDNECGRQLRSLVGADDTPLPSLAEAGFVGTNIMNDYPTTSATDVALLFKDLYSNELLPKQLSNSYLTTLQQQEISNRLPQGLGEYEAIAHKTADLEGFSHDGGIVYTNFGDYVIVVMSGEWTNEYVDAPPVISDISGIVYDWFSSRN